MRSCLLWNQELFSDKENRMKVVRHYYVFIERDILAQFACAYPLSSHYFPCRRKLYCFATKLAEKGPASKRYPRFEITARLGVVVFG